jgi:hypothetical protein
MIHLGATLKSLPFFLPDSPKVQASHYHFTTIILAFYGQHSYIPSTPLLVTASACVPLPLNTPLCVVSSLYDKLIRAYE